MNTVPKPILFQNCPLGRNFVKVGNSEHPVSMSLISVEVTTLPNQEHGFGRFYKVDGTD